jgi:hypothetical protein
MDAVMEESSHLNLMTMALLQTCGYVMDQMQTKVTVNINKFLEAFSIEGDGGRIRPPSWSKSGDSVVITHAFPSPMPPHFISKESAKLWVFCHIFSLSTTTVVI